MLHEESSARPWGPREEVMGVTLSRPRDREQGQSGQGFRWQ